MKQIILTPAKRDLILQFRDQFGDTLKERHIDVDPVLLKDGNYILPEAILTDGAHIDLIPQMIKGLGNLVIREVAQSELITDIIK